MFGLNTNNSTISIESIGYCKYKGCNGSVFTIDGNRIKSGHVYLSEILIKFFIVIYHLNLSVKSAYELA